MGMVLVTGADGFVGRTLTKTLRDAGYTVRRALRKESAPARGMESVVVGDIGADTNWSAALEGVDYVVHLAARNHVMNEVAADPLAEFRKVNVDGTRRLAMEAAKAGVKNFVYFSSIKVNGEGSLDPDCKPYTEDDPPNPDGPYGVSKLEAELALAEAGRSAGLKYVIIRPPLVYAFGAPGNFGALERAVKKGMPLPLGGIRNRRSLVYLGNLADAVRACLENPASHGKTYLVCDGDAVSTPELIRRIAEALGKKAFLLPFPEPLIKLLGSLTGKTLAVHRLLGSLVVDGSRIRKELNWTPPYGMVDGLKASLSDKGD